MTHLNTFYTEHLTRMAEGYARLALVSDAAKAHAWSEAKLLAKRDETIYGTLPNMVVARAKELQKHA